MTRYAETLSSTYLMLERLTADAVKEAGHRPILIGKTVEALSMLASNIVELAGCLSLIEAYIRDREGARGD